MGVRLSVAIPTVGRDTLRATLRSLERQTTTPHEVIVVNQGSPDVEAQLGGGSTRFLHQAIKGLSRARNAAFEAFTGDWIAFIDDDEEANAEWVEQIVAAIEAYPQIDFLGGVYFQPIGHKPEDGFCSEIYALGEQILDRETWLIPMGAPTLQRDAWGGNSCFSRRCYETIGGYDQWLGRGAPHFTSGEDTDFALRALSAGFKGLLSCRVIIYHTYGVRPYSDDMTNELAALGAVMKWKAQRDPERVDRELARRLHPFGKKKALLAKISGGRLFPEDDLLRRVFEASLEKLDDAYDLESGRLVSKASA